ncbi:MAG: hypothetical protein ACYDH6_07910 [Acidimicrobiales bacterium]
MIDTLTSVEDTALEGIKQAQTTALGVAKTVVDTVSAYVPELPVTYPAQLPEPAALVDNLFVFAGNILAANRAFTAQLLEAVAPLAIVKPEPKPAPKAAPKAAA